MPQLSQIGEIYASQFFWLAIVFGLIYFGIGKAMVPKIERTIDDRAARIAADLAAAETARAEARTADERYQAGLENARSQALKAVTEAKAAATAATEAQIKASDEAMNTRLVEATRRIDETRAAALGEIEATTVDAVEAIVAKLSGASVDRDQAASKVKAELAHG
jgi:F-type H+-transporting ATPase subunit b